MDKFDFLNVEFEQNFMQFAKWYDFFAQGFNCVGLMNLWHEQVS